MRVMFDMVVGCWDYAKWGLDKASATILELGDRA
jgi:hypothetical protein